VSGLRKGQANLSPKTASSPALFQGLEEATLICEGMGANPNAQATVEWGSTTTSGLARKIRVQAAKSSHSTLGKSFSPRRAPKLNGGNDYTKRYLEPQMSNGPIPLTFHIESFARSASVPKPAHSESVGQRNKGGAPMIPPQRTTWASMQQLQNGLVGDFHVHGTNPGFARTQYGGMYTNYK
jgi:hypothetical protein